MPSRAQLAALTDCRAGEGRNALCLRRLVCAGEVLLVLVLTEYFPILDARAIGQEIIPVTL